MHTIGQWSNDSGCCLPPVVWCARGSATCPGLPSAPPILVRACLACQIAWQRIAIRATSGSLTIAYVAISRRCDCEMFQEMFLSTMVVEEHCTTSRAGDEKAPQLSRNQNASICAAPHADVRHVRGWLMPWPALQRLPWAVGRPLSALRKSFGNRWPSRVSERRVRTCLRAII